MPWMLFWLFISFLAFSMEIEHESKPLYAQGKNIAVFGAGTTNCYASLLLAKYFSEHTNRPFDQLFDQAWGISGGAIAATLLMAKKFTEAEAASIFRTTVEQGLPGLSLFFNLSDTNSDRRNKFEFELKKHFDGMSFGHNNRFVYIASNKKGEPVYYCDEDVKLEDNALRCPAGTSCIKGMVGSCCYICNCDQFPTTIWQTLLSAVINIPEIHLFKQEPQILNPRRFLQEIYDGALCTSDDNNIILDGYSPLPLVIKYLQNLSNEEHQEHNIIAFENGWASSKKFRELINLKDNVAVIKTGNTTINVFIISIHIGAFQTLSMTMNRSKEHFDYLEEQARDAIERTSAYAWNAAIAAISKSVNYREKF